MAKKEKLVITKEELLQITEQRFQKVRKSNDLVVKPKNDFVLSAQQQKIVAFLISKIQPYDEDFKEIVFDIKEYCKVAGIIYNSGEYYEEIKESIKTLADKSAWVKIDSNGTETLIRWIKSPTIDRNKGQITIEFDTALKPYLLKLTGYYTEYDLINPLSLSSKYSIRLYEILKSYHFRKTETFEKDNISLSELKQLLGVFGKSYDNYSTFKTQILERAVAEINKKTDMNVSFQPQKLGRCVVGIKFIISSKDTKTIAQINADNSAELDRHLIDFSE